MTELAALEQRIRRLEDREEIAALIARYALVMDNRDMEQMPELFTADVVIRSQDGVMDVRGRDDAVALFRGRFTVLGPSNHFSHDRIITFDPNDCDTATGIVLSHAEMNRKGEAMLAAIRYYDHYRRDNGTWRFSERILTFFYYVPTAQYLDALGSDQNLRMRAYEKALPADWPEKLATWQRYYGS